jgi:hypothetical protein
MSGEIGAGSGEQTDNSVAKTENHTLNRQRQTSLSRHLLAIGHYLLLYISQHRAKI